MVMWKRGREGEQRKKGWGLWREGGESLEDEENREREREREGEHGFMCGKGK